MEIERLPEINFYSEVNPGISNEWDMFWIMPHKEKVEYFEISPDFRKNKIRFIVESSKER